AELRGDGLPPSPEALRHVGAAGAVAGRDTGRPALQPGRLRSAARAPRRGSERLLRPRASRRALRRLASSGVRCERGLAAPGRARRGAGDGGDDDARACARACRARSCDAPPARRQTSCCLTSTIIWTTNVTMISRLATTASAVPLVRT